MNAFRLPLQMALILAICAYVQPEARQQVDLPAIVASFHPIALDSLSMQANGKVLRQNCYAVLASDASGPSVVVAAYSNTTSSAVLLLTRSASGFQVSAAADESDEFFGGSCEATAVDVDADGRREVLLKFFANRGSNDWMFGWSDDRLINMTPVHSGSHGEHESELRNAEVIDANGDGVSELYSFSMPPMTAGQITGQPAPSRIYRLQNGTFVLDRPVMGRFEFEREAGTPVTRTVEFGLATGAVGPFSVRIVNGSGAAGGAGTRVENAVESARVWLNGEQIAGPSDFGTQVATIVRQVPLQAENQLQVRLAGTVGGRIAITIEASSWQ